MGERFANPSKLCGRTWRLTLVKRVSAVALAAALSLFVLPACNPFTNDVEEPRRKTVARLPRHALKLRCHHQIWGGITREYPRWRQKSLIAGPVAFYPARSEYPDIPEDYLRPVNRTRRGPRFLADQLKLQVVISGRERAVVRIADPARDDAAFLFRVPYKRKGFYISEGDRALEVRGCGDRRYTEYSTGFIVKGPRCLPISVFVEGRREPIQRVMAIGTQRC